MFNPFIATDIFLLFLLAELRLVLFVLQKLPVRAVVVSKTWRPALPRVMGEELLALLPLAFKATKRKCDQGVPDWGWNYEYVHRDEYARLENERDLLFRALQRQVATNPPAQPLPSIPGLITSEQRYALFAYILMCQEQDRIAAHNQLLREAEVARQAEARVRRERRERNGTSYYYYRYEYICQWIE
ncbi:hypothetical protein ACQRIU_000158 [Beauveria bassiana]